MRVHFLFGPRDGAESFQPFFRPLHLAEQHLGALSVDQSADFSTTFGTNRIELFWSGGKACPQLGKSLREQGLALKRRWRFLAERCVGKENCKQPLCENRTSAPEWEK